MAKKMPPSSNNKLYQFVNCRILRNHKFMNEDLWVRNGKIVDPESVFYDEKNKSDQKIDCQGCLLVPGFIDIQINGGFGYDFSNAGNKIDEAISIVSKCILAHGVTSYCPTIVTSPPDVYKLLTSRIKKCNGNAMGAAILGLHLEGPYISEEKKGAHPAECIKKLDKEYSKMEEFYGNMKNVAIVTLAPELTNAMDIIKHLKHNGITVSIGHSMADLKIGETAVQCGSTLITHLFNAMLPFHHRDPGLVGLLASDKIPKDKTVYFGIISDGVHTHPAALRIAYRTHPDGLCLVTDAISAMGLQAGTHNIGQLQIDIRGGKAYVSGTNTLCGSIANMNECVKVFKKATGCSNEYVCEAASLHPAQALGIDKNKGSLNFGCDADFLLLNSDLDVQSTWIAGQHVYTAE